MEGMGNWAPTMQSGTEELEKQLCSVQQSKRNALEFLHQWSISGGGQLKL